MLRWLGPSRELTVLSTALRASDGAERASIAQPLIDAIAKQETPAPQLVLSLAACWDDLSEPQQEQIRPWMATRWPEVISTLAADADPRARAASMRLLAEVGGGAAIGCAKNAVDLLADADPLTADRAEAALLELIRVARTPGATDLERETVIAAVDQALENFDRHRRSGVLRAAVKLMPVAGGRTMAWMNDPQHPALMVMRGLIRRGTESDLRASAWSWLKVEGLAPACVERLAQPVPIDQHAPVLEKSFLLLHPARARAMARAKLTPQQIAAVFPKMSEADDLPERARGGLAQMIAAAPVESRLKDAAWASRLADTSAAARLSVLRTIIEQGRPPASLMDMVFDADPRIATLAADAVLATAPRDALVKADRDRLAARLLRSQHASVRALARQLMSGPSGSEARLAEMVEVVATYRGRSDDAAMARRAAMAVTKMAEIHDPEAEVAIRACLQLPDPRVRANAVDALVSVARREPAVASTIEAKQPSLATTPPADTIIEVLLDHTLDPHHRIRASAARGLLTMGTLTDDQAVVSAGQRTLASMLSDQRPMHRVAGLWLAERLAPVVVSSSEIIDAVTTAEHRAFDLHERLRAERAGERLNVEIRTNWSRRAATLVASATGASTNAAVEPATSGASQ